jgi:hypothetical protein
MDWIEWYEDVLLFAAAVVLVIVIGIVQDALKAHREYRKENHP